MATREIQPLKPHLNDPLFHPFWEGAQAQKLMLRQCNNCKAYQWPPRPMCANCSGCSFSWVEGDGEGRVYTYVVAHRAFHPSFEDRVPYILVVVDVAPGVRILGNLLGTPPEKVKIGMPVSVEFVKQLGGSTLVCWRPKSE